MDLTAFKNGFNGGTRGNRFVVNGAIGTVAAADHTFHVASSFIPAVPQMVLEMNAFGRKLYIPGDREYVPWSIKVYDDHSTSGNDIKKFWQAFTEWQERINEHDTNITAINFPHLDYKTTWTVKQLDINGTNTLKEFKLIGCWPRSVGQIEFNMTRRNFLNTFPVVLAYDEILITDV